MKTLVVYTSKRGSTEKYAKWIGQELSCDVVPFSKDFLPKMKDYDKIIYGGWVRGGGIVGLEIIKKNFKLFEEKKLIVFAVGLSIDNKDNYMQLRDINFKSPLNLIPLYVLPGAFIPNKVKGSDKVIISVLKKIVGSKKNKGEENSEQGKMVENLENGVDLVDKKYIDEIVLAARNL